MSHITLHVRNMEDSVAFYEKLGYESRLQSCPVVSLDEVPLGGRVEFGGQKVIMGIMSLGLDPRTETCLELLELVNTPAGGKPNKPFAETGVQRHCYRVSNLDATVTGLREEGLEVQGEPLYFDEAGTPSRYQFLKDSDDNLIELIELDRVCIAVHMPSNSSNLTLGFAHSFRYSLPRAGEEAAP